jgi:hypothetical protein
VDGSYDRPAAAFAEAADITIHLVPGREVARARRSARGVTVDLRTRLTFRVLRLLGRTIGTRTAPALSQRAHLAPVLRLRTDEEVDALVRGLFRGAGVLEETAP